MRFYYLYKNKSYDRVECWYEECKNHTEFKNIIGSMNDYSYRTVGELRYIEVQESCVHKVLNAKHLIFKINIWPLPWPKDGIVK